MELLTQEEIDVLVKEIQKSLKKGKGQWGRKMNEDVDVGDDVKVKINFGFGIVVMKILAIHGDIVTLYHEPTGIVGRKHRWEVMPLKKNIKVKEG